MVVVVTVVVFYWLEQNKSAIHTGSRTSFSHHCCMAAVCLWHSPSLQPLHTLQIFQKIHDCEEFIKAPAVGVLGFEHLCGFSSMGWAFAVQRSPLLCLSCRFIKLIVMTFRDPESKGQATKNNTWYSAKTSRKRPGALFFFCVYLALVCVPERTDCPIAIDHHQDI